MSLKTETFEFLTEISADGRCSQRVRTPGELQLFQLKHKGLRLKYENDGSVLLNFAGRGPWYSQKDFLNVFYATQLVKLEESLSFVLKFGSDDVAEILLEDTNLQQLISEFIIKKCGYTDLTDVLQATDGLDDVLKRISLLPKEELDLLDDEEG